MRCVNPAAQQSVFCRFNNGCSCIGIPTYIMLSMSLRVANKSLTGKRTPEHIHNVVMNAQVFHGREHAKFCFTVA